MTERLEGSLEVHEQFHCPPLRFPRNLSVWLPPGYHSDTSIRFPVCYLHDGQNLFDPSTAFLGNDWGLGATAAELIGKREIEPLILVGIWNTGERRLHEYTPVRDRRRRGGGARRYGEAIIASIKPFIDSRYRTRPGPEDTGLGGSSLGGLATLYIGLRNPKVFGKLIVMSPSAWWADRNILSMVAGTRFVPGQKIWLDTGTLEGDFPARMVEDVRTLRDRLVDGGRKPGVDLAYCEDEGAFHCEQAWGGRVASAFRFLFPVF